MNRSYDRRIFTLAVPALGSLMADPLVSLVDTAFVGRLGSLSLAALGVDAAIFAIAFWVFVFLSYGITPLVSHAIGADDQAKATRLIGSGLSAAIGLGLLIVVALELTADPLLNLMGATGDVHGEAVGYLRIRALAAPAVLIIMLGHGAFRGHHNTLTPLVVTLGLNVVNLVLDPILMFGVGWDLNGAAVATLVAQWMGAAWFLVLMRLRLGVRVRGGSSQEMWTLLRVGRDVVIRSAAIVIVFTGAARVATAVGDIQIAAHQVVFQLLNLLAHIADALAISAQMLVARFAGQRREAAAWAVSIRLVWLGAMVGVAFFVLLVAVRSVVPGWFSNDSDVVDAVREVLPILILLQPFSAPIYVWEGIVMGASDFGYLARTMVLSAAVALVVLLLVVPLGWGLPGVWWGLVTLNVVRGLTLAWWHLGPHSRLRPRGGSSD